MVIHFSRLCFDPTPTKKQQKQQQNKYKMCFRNLFIINIVAIFFMRTTGDNRIKKSFCEK